MARSRTHRLAPLALLIAALVAILFLLLRPRRESRGRPVVQVTPAPLPTLPPGEVMSELPTAPHGPEVFPGAKDVEEELAKELRDPREFKRRMVEEYRKRARYPKNNEPLFHGETDPIHNDNHQVRREVNEPRGGTETLIVAGPMSSVIHPQPLEVTAWVEDRGEKVSATISAELAKGPPNPIDERIKMEFRDDGKGGDLVAGDQIHTWRMAPKDGAEAERMTGIHTIYVTATFRSKGIFASTGWNYSAGAGAKLTGKFRDSLVKGSVLIEPEVEVKVPGRYHLQVSLHAGDQPIVWAQNTTTLEANKKGKYWVPIEVYGTILTDAAAAGPYTVKRIWLRDVSTVPPKDAGLLLDAHVTAAYALADLTSEPFNDPVDIAKMKHYEEQVAEDEGEDPPPGR